MRFPQLAVALVLTGLTFSSAVAEDRSAEAILKDIDAVVMPQFDPSKGRDQAAIQEYLAKRKEAVAKRKPLILELFQQSSRERPAAEADAGAVVVDVAYRERMRRRSRRSWTRRSDRTTPELRTEARFLKVRLAMIENRTKPEAAFAGGRGVSEGGA